MNWKLLKQIGYHVYKCEDWRDYKRYYVFLGRCGLNRRAMDMHMAFFSTHSNRQKLMTGCPWLIDQATRQVFYKGSTFPERAIYIQEHIKYMEQLFKPELMERIYAKGERVSLWRDEFDGKPFILFMNFRDGQQKEGCLSIELVYDSDDELHTGWSYGTHVYQIMFALGGKDLTIKIGALQGLAGGSDFIKKLAKHYFGYRPKNLILWCLRCIAVTIGAKEITAVSNSGYYAMNHIRLDRKLKVDLDGFWEETGGSVFPDDTRFYHIPIEEHRKTMSEMKPSKRANHRRRYELMDNIAASIQASLAQYMNPSL